MSAEAKRSLEACENGVNQMIAISKANQEKVDYYNNTEIPEFNRKQEEWKIRGNDRRRDQDNWRKRYEDEKNKLSGEEEVKSCGGIWTNEGCSGGWRKIEDRHCGALNAQRQSVCRRNDDEVERIARERVGPRPGDFNEMEPQRPSPPEQNNSNINISCCANITQIIASQVNDSTINQANDCMSNLRQGYDNAVVKEQEEGKRKEEEETKRKEEEEERKRKEEERKSLMKKLGVGGFIILCSCALLFIVISLSFGFSSGGEETDMEYASSTYSTPTYVSVPTSIPTSVPTSVPPPPYSETSNENSGFFGGLF
uniref:Uncharacterized protein n=1 Tax=viral metagenome TaxID=1070528 RepID=A0A6C0DZM2_9ZZZZ